ncbi:hypothetical protein Tco_0562398 [Tanacetum coccineum]
MFWNLGPKSVERASVLHQPDGVGSQRHHIVPYGELNGVSIALVARVRRRRERVVGFEETQNKGESMVERSSEGGRPSEEASRGNGSQNVNLPPLLAAHIGRSENGQPLQSSLTSAYGGQALLNNVRGNLLPNDLPPTYKGLMEKTYTWVEAREVATNGVSNDRRDSFKRPRKSSWNNNKGQMDRSRSFPYKGESHKLLSNLVKSPRDILATERLAKTFECPPWLPGPNWRKEERRKASIGKNLYPYGKRKRQQAEEETCERQWDRRNHVPPIPNEGSSDPVVIKVYISGRQVNMAYLDSGSSCEVIYKHCFLKLKPSIRSLRVDSNTPLVGFWEKSRDHSPHNLLLGRIAMQEMGIVVSTVHGAIKFHMPNGVGTILAEHNSQRLMEEKGNSTNNGQGDVKDILSCIDTKEKIVIDYKYPE